MVLESVILGNEIIAINFNRYWCNEPPHTTQEHILVQTNSNGKSI